MTVIRVSVPLAGQPAEVELEHEAYPRLRFRIELTGDGVVGLQVADRRMLADRRPWDRADWAKEPPAPLTARLVHALPLGALERRARRAVLEETQPFLAPKYRTTGYARSVTQLVESVQRTMRPGRRGRPIAEYAALAARYVELLKEGRGLPGLARDIHLSDSQVRNLLYAARQKGLLTAAPKGKAGGELTEKAKQLLAEGND